MFQSIIFIFISNKIIVVLFLVVSAVDYEVDIYNSRGEIISNSSEVVVIYSGDYIYCKYPGDVIGPIIYYGWVKIDDGTGINRFGPNFISLPNTEDQSNR